MPSRTKINTKIYQELPNHSKYQQTYKERLSGKPLAVINSSIFR